MTDLEPLKTWILGTVAAHPERTVDKRFLLELLGVIDYLEKKECH